jgi:hypothetical protein
MNKDYYDIITKNDYYRLCKNYEALINIIEVDKQIINVLKKAISKEEIKSKDLKIYVDSRGYELFKISKDTKIYKASPWFYTTEQGDDIYSEIQQATYNAMLLGGGVNCYITKEELRIFLLNDKNINRLIKDYIKKLQNNNNKNNEYYKEITSLLNSIDSSTLDKNKYHALYKFLSMIIKCLGYDGTYINKNTMLYDKSEYMIVSMDKISRFNSDKYDWEQWGVSDFILPNDTFMLNTKYYLSSMIGFDSYNFYKKMLIPSVKLEEEFDIGTINVNKFNSINSIDTLNNCIKGIIDAFKNYSLKILCLQEIDTKVINELTSLLEAENLYASINNSLCVVSKGKLELIPSNNAVTFNHPNYKKTKFMNICTDNIEALKPDNSDVIIGTIAVSSYKKLSTMGYSTNDINMEPTTVSNEINDYILTKLPNTLSLCVSVNYKYSNHRLVLGKLI